jgi:MoaA/NifB/PqqE/SkfB family radical SAM enzyme
MGELTALEHAAREETRLRKPLAIAKMERYAEKLARNESVAMIQLQWGYQCNIECEHCSISVFQGRRPEGTTKLTLAKLRAVYDEAHDAGLAQTTISGGEPLIFKDLLDVVKAIGPERFFIQIDTNGWYLDAAMAASLKAAGVDKMQVSLDSSIAAEHDTFRRAPGAYARAVAGIANAKAAGMAVVIATVITRQRIYTPEFRDFLNFCRDHDYPLAYLWPKLTGEWEGAHDALPRLEDIAFMDTLGKEYHLKDRTSPWFGLDVGCNAMKRSITLTDVGNIFSCHWQYWSIGNVWEMPLNDILKKGMRYYGKRTNVCSVSQDHAFINKYVAKTFGRGSTDKVLTVEDVLGTPEEFDQHVPVRIGSDESNAMSPVGRRLVVLEV